MLITLAMLGFALAALAYLGLTTLMVIHMHVTSPSWW